MYSRITSSHIVTWRRGKRSCSPVKTAPLRRLDQDGLAVGGAFGKAGDAFKTCQGLELESATRIRWTFNYCVFVFPVTSLSFDSRTDQYLKVIDSVAGNDFNVLDLGTVILLEKEINFHKIVTSDMGACMDP